MTSGTWAHSPTYGRAVALGPAQRDVFDLVLRMTRGGRRPELTLGRLSSLTGRPVSSVHDALGRLRALGLIGVSARTGRSGGHRLWRVGARPSPRSHTLDVARHRRAVARMIRRWYGRPRRPVPVPVAYASDDPPAAPPRSSAQDGSDAPRVTRPEGLDPFGVTPSTWEPAPESMSFGDRLRRAGLGAWIDERDHGKRGS